MCCIVLCHYLQYYGNELAWWFNVGVQIFFVVSGYLYGGKSVEEPIGFILKQARKILIPYYSFLLPAILLYILFARDSFSVFSAICAILCVGTVEGIGHLWFVGYILFCYLITPYLSSLKKYVGTTTLLKEVILWGGVLLLICAIGELTGAYIKPERLCCYVSGYAIASIKEHFGEKVIRFIATIVTVSAVVMNVVKVLCKYCFDFENETIIVKLCNALDGYAHMLLGLTLFFLLYVAFKRTKSNSILKFTDKYSYYIYLVHQLFILSPFSLMYVTQHNILNWAITLVSIILSAIMLYFVSNKIENIIFKRRFCS